MKHVWRVLPLLACTLSVCAEEIAEPPTEIPIAFKGGLEIATARMYTVNQMLGKRQSGGEWELLLASNDVDAFGKLKVLCPECIDLDPIPTVPLVEPRCSKLHSVSIPKSLKLTSNTSYISKKLELFKAEGVLAKTDISYTTMFPSKDVIKLNETFADCNACIELDPIPVVPVVIPNDEPCR